MGKTSSSEDFAVGKRTEIEVAGRTKKNAKQGSERLPTATITNWGKWGKRTKGRQERVGKEWRGLGLGSLKKKKRGLFL